jgi:16S rRNA (uracil1498-N3)-methyltransferase
MSRFFASVSDGTALVSGEEAAHMAKTLRMKKGDAFTVIDNSGYEYRCEIEAITPQSITGRVLASGLCGAEPGVKLTLYQAYPKAAKMEVILQKCVEIGVTGFVPFISERCVKKPEKDDANKLNRLKRVAQEAVKQCGRAVVPEVSDIKPFADVLRMLSGHGLKLLAWEEEKAQTLKKALKSNPEAKDIALVIGSEGGFSAKEAEAMKKAGVIPVSLGKRILRTETAGMAAAAMILYELEES